MTDKKVEEIEIALDADFPLSKKEQRLIKKGKITLEELQKKKAADAATDNINASKTTPEDEEQKNRNGIVNEDEKPVQPKTERSQFGVWVGNLSFETSKEDLINFITTKTEDYTNPESELCQITEDDIVRVNLPRRNNKNKGFAYVDFKTEPQLKTALTLSESNLNGRNMLIKNSKSYEGRPEKVVSKNPPSRILFVGNLSFDTSTELLEEHFRHCGEIVKIRMATFEDSGKCKGFAFIDFKDDEGPTNALQDKGCKKLINRPLRLEFGEDRSNRRVVTNNSSDKRPFNDVESNKFGTKDSEFRNKRPHFDEEKSHDETTKVSRGFQPKQDKTQKNFRPSYNSYNNYNNNDMASNKRVKSSVALAKAPRQSAAIVKSKGKKVVFD